MKEDDYVEIDVIKEATESDIESSIIFTDIMTDFLDMSEIANSCQKIMIQRKQAIFEHTRKSLIFDE